MRRVIVHGLGVEGRAAVDHFASGGASVSSFDAGGASAAGAEPLTAEQVSGQLGPDLLYLRSPGVPLGDALVSAARRAGASVTTPTGWWLANLAPAGTITITGTKGKSTTTALCAATLREAGVSSAAYGNIGAPPLGRALPSETAPVVELSSYMCADLIAPPSARRWRHALTNLYKEHTTWHGDVSAYRAAKLRPWRWDPPCPGVAPRAVIADEALPPSVVALEDLAALDGHVLTVAGEALDLSRLSDAFLSPGLRQAARMAAAILRPVLGAKTLPALAAAGAAWAGLPSRQASVASSDGRRWIDDALATVPEAVDQALDRFGTMPVRIVLGGKDRGQDLSALLVRISDLPDAKAYGFGEVADQIARRFPAFPTLEDAVLAARADCPVGGVVLFSPAAPSGPPHKDYTERAAIFARLAREA